MAVAFEYGTAKPAPPVSLSCKKLAAVFPLYAAFSVRRGYEFFVCI
jgi:hypothetical protein